MILSGISGQSLHSGLKTMDLHVECGCLGLTDQQSRPIFWPARYLTIFSQLVPLWRPSIQDLLGPNHHTWFAESQVVQAAIMYSGPWKKLGHQFQRTFQYCQFLSSWSLCCVTRVLIGKGWHSLLWQQLKSGWEPKKKKRKRKIELLTLHWLKKILISVFCLGEVVL